jgi:chemotaxis protein MotB
MKRRHDNHGGSWKVAYADFITAMMALFLVLWLTAQDTKVKEAIERSFRNPFSSVTKESTGIIPNRDVHAMKSTKGSFDSASAVELTILRKLADDLIRVLASNPEEFDDNPVKMELTPDGLRITMFDRAKKPLFQEDSSRPTPYGLWVLSTLAWEVARFTNMFNIEVEGHTEQGRVPRHPEYGSWEISTDRANTARRKLIEHGVGTGEIRKVTGYADTMPMAESSPADEINRRVALVLRVREEERKHANL